MTQREKILGLAVAGLLLVLGAQYVISNYRDALSMRRDRRADLNDEVMEKTDFAMAGAMADAEIAELRKRSLPSDPEQALAFYQNWLLELVKEVGLESPDVDVVTSVPVADLYRQYSFKVSGRGDARQLARFLYGFHNRDLLHRIKRSSLRRRPDTNLLSIDFDIEAIALNNADPDRIPEAGPAPRVRMSEDEYVAAIVNRNAFAPPNKAPQFAAGEPPEAYVGRDYRFVAKFDDPDGQNVQYELVGDAPSWLDLDAQSGELRGRPSAEGDYSVTVRATDNGLPAQTTEHELQVAVKPPPDAEPAEEPEFDEAKQAVLTGLVRSGDAWVAWIHVRTTGELLKLREGDTLEVGQIKGTIAEIEYQFAVIESDEGRWVLRPRQTVAEAYQAGMKD